MFTFCKPVTSKKRFSPLRKLNDEYAFTLYENIDFCDKHQWNSVLEGKDIYLSCEYLRIVEHCSDQLTCRYVIVYRNNEPVGIIYYQSVNFKAEVFGTILSKQTETNDSKRIKFFGNYIDSNKHETLMRLFTCGNNLVTGEHGFLFKQDVSNENKNELVQKITEIIAKEEKSNCTISAVLIKDFDSDLRPEKVFQDGKYTEFKVEPNMVVSIPEGVNSLNEYIELFSKKYRNRAKSIFKSGAPLTVKKLTLQEVQSHNKEIYSLYEQVYNTARFKLLKLPVNYFEEMKRNFPSVFFINGFFLEDQLIAFSSHILINEKCLEAHYIGFDYRLNNDFDLYQNILYNNIECAIANKRQNVNLGRTAAEIKTTVGAKPVDQICYVKPQNTISKFILNPLISFLQPGNWTPRNPFKETNEVTL